LNESRSGYGETAAATGCRRTPELLGVLSARLAAVKAEPPYVLVGTSGGGYLMTSYAYAHPSETAGIVLAETPHAIIPSRVPRSLLAELNCRSSLNQEHRDYVAVERYSWTHRHQVDRIPMTVISNDYGDNWENAEEKTNVQGQRGWLALSPLALQGRGDQRPRRPRERARPHRPRDPPRFVGRPRRMTQRSRSANPPSATASVATELASDRISGSSQRR
jgi:pimeloyl-ACP methyl ester carboxylesterase